MHDRAVVGEPRRARHRVRETGPKRLAARRGRAISPNAQPDVGHAGAGDATWRRRVDKISFDVSEIGKPVEVKESYFPNWKVSGAKGPYRLAPNLMVVVPTRATT